MLKKQSKAIAVAMALVFCLSFIAVAPPQADATSTATALRVETVSAVNTRLTTPVIQLDIPSVSALTTGDLLTVHLPSGIKLDNTAAPKVDFGSAAGANYFLSSATTIAASPGGTNARVFAPARAEGNEINAFNIAGSTTLANNAFIAYPVGTSALEIKVVDASLLSASSDVGRLQIQILNALVDSTFDGDISATLVAPNNSGFSSGSVVFAKYLSGGSGTLTTIKSVKKVSDAVVAIDTLMIQELVRNSIENDEVIKIKLPSGFKWDNAGTATGAWAFTGLTFTPNILDDRTLTITAPTSGLGNLASEGRLYLENARIAVDDESVAKKGDVVANVSSNEGNVTDQEVVVAQYVDFTVNITEETVAEVVAGKADTELGAFVIGEAIAGSLVPGRTVTLTLPDGVKWDVGISGSYNSAGTFVSAYTASSVISETVLSGADFTSGTGASQSLDSSKRVLKYTLPTTLSGSHKVKFSKLRVAISPDFTGDINVEVAGTAGAKGEVKVATVQAPITVTASAPASIIIGSQGQVIGDVTIVENKKEAIDAAAGANTVRLMLPVGATWTSLPTVTVPEGDLVLDKVTWAPLTDNRGIDVVFKSTSTTPSTVKISNIKVTTNRTLPEGEFKLSVNGEGSTALTDLINNTSTGSVNHFNISNITSAVIGNCVTPAPSETEKVGQFNIGSNIYYLNGSPKIMDVAPYIKASRTYVPVRYLGYVLGLTDDQIQWDAAAQTVTFTKGTDTVVLTIGSKTLTKNGVASTMDVAPEIVNSRTMLPARFVAEAFGATVGWNAPTNTVLIQSN